MQPIIKPVILFFVFLCMGCATSWPVYDTELTKKTIVEEQKITIPFIVAVKAAPMAEFRKDFENLPESWMYENMARTTIDLVADLKKISLFSKVYEWSPNCQFDILIEARADDGVIRCGTPFLIQAFTLYLMSAESSYQRRYQFQFISPKTGDVILFDHVYCGSYYQPSILLLPFLAMQNRLDAYDLLRHDIVSIQKDLMSLAN